MIISLEGEIVSSSYDHGIQSVSILDCSIFIKLLYYLSVSDSGEN